MKKSSKKLVAPKTKKTVTKTEAPKPTEIRKVAPEVPEGAVSVVLSYEDMRTFANLLSITAKTFEGLALKAAQENDEASFTILQARHRLSSLFAEKLVDACKMPEPISRDFH